MNHLFAAYTFAKTNIDTDTPFAARPLKQWRKQYQTTVGGYSRASVGMPMDRPGGLVPVASPAIECQSCRGAFPAKVTVFNDAPCTSCQPKTYGPGGYPYLSLKKNRNDTRFTETTYTNTKAYLQSRCLLADQQVSTARVPTITYFSPEGKPLEPNDEPDGPQVRETANCFKVLNVQHQPQPACGAAPIYKPNNAQYAQQGGVSASSRLARLKYNTLNNNGADANSASGAMGSNSGRYQMEPSPSYYTKFKPQPAVCNVRNGSKTYCPYIPPPPPPPTNYAYIPNYAENTVAMYLIAPTGALVPLNPPKISTGTNPSAIAIATLNQNRYAYVTNSGDNTVSMYAIDTMGQLNPLTPPTIAAGNYPYSITIDVPPSDQSTLEMYYIDNAGNLLDTSSPDSYVYVINIDQTISLYAIDVPTGNLIALSPYPTNCNVPQAIALTNQYAYISNYCGNTIEMYTAAATTGFLTALSPPSIPTGANPSALAIALDRYMYATNSSDDTISIYTVPANGILVPIATVPCGGHYPTAIAIAANNYVYVTNADSDTISTLGLNSANGTLTLLPELTIGGTAIAIIFF
jgi:6-phosphogluconolactonase (cycloisomerase 2 family)